MNLMRYKIFLYGLIISSLAFPLFYLQVSRQQLLRRKAMEAWPTPVPKEEQTPISEWVPIDVGEFNTQTDKRVQELNLEISLIKKQRLSLQAQTKKLDPLERELNIQQINKEEHNLMDENKDGKIDYAEFNKRDVILANKIYKLRHTTLSNLPNGLYDEQLRQITPENRNQYSSSTQNLFRVFVEAGIYQDILSSLQQYRIDVINDWNYNVQFYLCNNCTKEQIKDLLKVQGTIGTVFVGNLPVAWFKSNGDVYPVDYYFMDIDGIWSKAITCVNGNRELICFTNHGGDLKPEIFFSRLTTPVENDEIGLLNNYFRKNHNFRRGHNILPHRSLGYIDDDFVPYFGSSNQNYLDRVLKMVYSVSDLVTDSETTNPSDLKNRWSNNYEHLYLAAHSNHLFHQFFPSFKEVFSFEVRDLKPHFFFYNLYACSVARFTEENYLAGWYVFQESDYGLLAIASVKTGAMLGIENFYNHIAQGDNFGTAFYKWFSYYFYAKYIDITMIGDPTLKIFQNFIGGRITTCDGLRLPIVNTQVRVLNHNSHQEEIVSTDNTGLFRLIDFVTKDEIYSVRVASAPSNFQLPPKTVTTGWSWNHFLNPNPGTQPWADTPYGSPSYEGQKAESNTDCAGPDSSGKVERCDFCLGFTTTPTPTPTINTISVGGQVVKCDSRATPVLAKVYIYDDTNGKQTRVVTTDSDGYFKIDGFVRLNDAYAVGISAVPAGYRELGKTTTTGWTWNHCVNPSLGTQPWADTPLDSSAYNCQIAGKADCAGPSSTGRTNRCDFCLDVMPGIIPCNGFCADNSKCSTNYCHTVDEWMGDARCRNKNCPEEIDCQCW